MVQWYDFRFGSERLWVRFPLEPIFALDLGLGEGLKFSFLGPMYSCLLYTSDAADDTPCVDLGGRRIIKKKKHANKIKCKRQKEKLQKIRKTQTQDNKRT
eukprot:TRINITY_DN27117_c0_g1_i1.p3 TRINITY_DN27117_c0_g1~~TRINITY_DN27117_c0_g1_i1.p3  ORF type:complete len:100 (+),score=5.47 TRINITY_DN27117_c0_g1_i1:265-564(+)